MDIATIELSELRHQPDSAAPTQEVLPDTAVVASELAPVDRGRDAWTFVASSFILETFLWGFAFCFGIFQNYLVSNPASPFYGSSNTAISIIGTCSLAVQYGFGFFPVMPIFSLYPHHVKTMLWSSLGVACGALVLSSFATKIWHLILLQGVVLGAAGGALYGPVLLWLPEWFVERRGLAGGIIFAGTGIGGGLFPVLLGTLLERTGFRWTMRIWAGLVTVFAGTALWVVKPRIRPSRARGARMAPVDWSFFKNRTFAVVGMTVFIQALAFFPVSLYLPAYTASLGLPAVDGQLVLSTFNIFSVLGQVIFGYLCDKVSYSQVILISSVGSALAAYLLWGFARNLSLVFAFVVVFGTLGGGFSSIEPPAAAELTGVNSGSSGILVGSWGVMKGLAAIVGPVIAGTLYNPADAATPSIYGLFGFGKVTLFVGSMMLATALAGVAAWLVSYVNPRPRVRNALQSSVE